MFCLGDVALGSSGGWALLVTSGLRQGGVEEGLHHCTVVLGGFLRFPRLMTQP